MERSTLFLLCFAALTIIFTEVIATSPHDLHTQNQQCTTPDKVSGICVSVFQCKKYFDIYKRVWGPTASEKDKQLLKSAHCGSRPLDQRVCCEKSAVSQTPEKNKNKPCGVSLDKNTAYVIGGKNSTLGSWPWMATIYHRNSTSTWFDCGGSLIASDWVLTAAHCIPTSPNVKLEPIRLGDLNIDESVNDGANPIEVKVKNVIPHPKFTGVRELNDIALIQLEEPVTFFDYISPICLHKGKEYVTNETIYDKKQPTVAGWGVLSTNGRRRTTHLQEVPLDTVPLEQCKKAYPEVDKSVLCCETPNKDSCWGDSGGPLMFKGKGSIWSQGGIVSYGEGCAQKDHPGVYTKVAAFIDWIEKETGMTF